MPDAPGDRGSVRVVVLGLIERLAAEGIALDRAAMLADSVVAGPGGATMMARARRDAAPLEHVATTRGVMVAAALDEARS